jgi:hypothetical protein
MLGAAMQRFSAACLVFLLWCGGAPFDSGTADGQEPGTVAIDSKGMTVECDVPAASGSPAFAAVLACGKPVSLAQPNTEDSWNVVLSIAFGPLEVQPGNTDVSVMSELCNPGNLPSRACASGEACSVYFQAEAHTASGTCP